jgi:hypothetical protein
MPPGLSTLLISLKAAPAAASEPSPCGRGGEAVVVEELAREQQGGEGKDGE